LPRVRPGRYRIMHKKAGKESDSSRFCLYLFHNDQIKIDTLDLRSKQEMR
jgi:hypothetical protein